MKYPFKVFLAQVDDHLFWIAEAPSLKGCVGQGETIEEAINELEENERVWLETAEELGMNLPTIPVETVNEYSGKFTVRIAPSTHRDAAEHAQKEGISLNQYVNDAIVSLNSKMETIDYICPKVKETVQSLKAFIMDSKPTFSEGQTLVTVKCGLFEAMKAAGSTKSENVFESFPAMRSS